MKTIQHTKFSNESQGVKLKSNSRLAYGNTLTVCDGEFILVLTHDDEIWEESMFHAGSPEEVPTWGDFTYPYGTPKDELVKQISENHPEFCDDYDFREVMIMGEEGESVLVEFDPHNNEPVLTS